MVEIRIRSLGVNEALGTRAKFIMNSCVGRFGMDVARHKSTKFVTEKNLTRNIRTPLTERYENLKSTEFQPSVYEVVKNKKVIVDQIPVAISLFIYENSKLHFFRFVLMLHEFLVPGSYRLQYCDTDSLMLSMSGKNIDDIVRSDKRRDWFEIEKPRWFADETPRQQKTPGYLKSEMRVENGTSVCLSSKVSESELKYILGRSTQNLCKVKI